eukprot:scaffold1247_cov170-Ochromonas_danica.AAC.12
MSWRLTFLDSLSDFDTAEQLSLPIDPQQRVYWMDDTRTILVWRSILDVIVTKRLILLEGAAGRGKSVL